MNKETFKLLQNIKSVEDIPKFLIDANLNNKLVEVGVWEGGGIENLCKCNPKLLLGVDCWDQSDDIKTSDGIGNSAMKAVYKKALNIMIKNPNVKYIKSYSDEYLDLYEDKSFDYVYIDGLHTYEQTKKDLVNWFDKVKSGGVLGGHDYFVNSSSYKFGVIEAVDEFVKEYQSKLYCFYVTPERSAPSYFMIKK